MNQDPAAHTADAAPSSEIEQRLTAIGQLLKRQLAAPDAESLVKVAAAHNELRRLPAELISAARVLCLLDVAQFFFISGQTVLGLEPAANAVGAARSLGEQALLRRALTFHGILLADTGNIPGAIECYAEALDLAQRLEDRLGEASVWNNLGTAFDYSAQYADSILAFQRVLELADRTPDLPQDLKSFALSNIALASLHTEDFATGLTSIKQSVELAGDPKTANQLLSRVNAESHYAWLLLEVNDLQRARERCELAKRFAAQSCSQRAEQVASIAEGLYEVYAGMVDIGLSRLQGALDRARILKATLRDALIAMVKAYDLCGKPQLALVHLRELLHVTRKSQQEKALLHHRLHLQALGAAMQPSELELATGAAQPLDRPRVAAQLALLHRQAVAAELVEDASGLHIYRVGKLAALLGHELGLDDDSCFMLEMSARLHDIGKIGVPDAILAKRGSISPDQRALIRTHANIGAELLSQSGLPQIQMAVEIARHHHEFWDGSGYPDGIAGGAIPEVARITTLADVFDVMTHARPYKQASTREAALLEIRRLKGTRFDPAMTGVFIALVERLMREQEDFDDFLATGAKESPFIQARQKIAAALLAGRSGAAATTGARGKA